jgi:hypothetical protein
VPQQHVSGHRSLRRELGDQELLERVKARALSSTFSWYSSGPITPWMWPRQCSSGSIRDAHQRAVCTISSAPRASRERLVVRPIDVTRGGPRHVGDDVLFQRPGENRYELATVVTQAFRRHVLA